jgi:hypothetical protein
MDAITGANYFAEVQSLLAVGDTIRVQLMEKFGSGNASYRSIVILSVVLGQDGQVVALPIAGLCGQCELANGSARSSDVINIDGVDTVGDAYCVLDGNVLAGTNVITVKNSTTTVFSGSLIVGSGVGTIVALTKNGSASADKFAAASFSVSFSGAATDASGHAIVVLNTGMGVPDEG